MDDPKGNGSADRVGAKCAFLGRLDLELAAAGYPVRAPAPAPPKPAPAPLLTFEAWAELSVRLSGAPPEALAAALAARGLTLEVWKRFDATYGRTLSDDLRAGERERPAVYEARYKEERGRLAGHVSAPAEGTPVAGSTPARAAFSGTNEAADLPAMALAMIGRMPFLPAAPPEKRPAPPGKRPVKTVESTVMPSPVGGETMDLNAALPRPTPNLPFVGTTGGAGPVYVPILAARQYVSLCAELVLKPAPPEETRRRYQVPNEAALRALEEHWRHPARRAELETALADFAVMLRGLVLR